MLATTPATPTAPAELLRVAERDETLEEARARNVRDALLEDVGSGDWTGHLAPAGQRLRSSAASHCASVP
jgi:nicotinate-nucleotide pyrophosphorylase (carboxylating)